MMKPAAMKQRVFLVLLLYSHHITIVLSSLSKPHKPPIDASALLHFKSKADLYNNLPFPPKNTTISFCKWQGVQCSNSRATKLIIEHNKLGGIFAPNTLTRLLQLRVLSLQNNSLTGRIPDLSGLVNLKSLFLSHNYFSGFIPPSISSLHRLTKLDLSSNMLSGPIPLALNKLNRLYYLRLDFNRFTGSIPPLNLSSLKTFNVSHNDLSGAVPVTPTLSRFDSFSVGLNPGLCGAIVHRECISKQPFFAKSSPPPSAFGLSQTVQSGGGRASLKRKKHKIAGLIIGFSVGVCVFVIALVCLILAAKKRNKSLRVESTKMPLTVNAEDVLRMKEDENELEEKVKRLQVVGRSGCLVFCAGEARVYTLDQLMRASAELLGRGTMGTTYKAVLDNCLIVTVKRLDGERLTGVSKEVFEEHMESVGGLRHPTLVPLRAYFQAKQERFLVYDYQLNGSVFSLIHGSKSARAKPLHWTSCLKIAEDVAQGLSYIHQAFRLVHGNLKASNILLGSDFEACLTDYCLAALTATHFPDEDDNSIAYKAPEIRKSSHSEATSKCDIYSFGVLLLELLTGKIPSQHLHSEPDEMMNWMRSVREDDSEENQSGMLLEVAMACSVASPEQRPTTWQVLKMIQEIKEVVTTEDGFLQRPHAA